MKNAVLISADEIITIGTRVEITGMACSHPLTGVVEGFDDVHVGIRLDGTSHQAIVEWASVRRVI